MGLKDCLVDLGVEVVKDKINNTKEEKQVRDRIKSFIEREYDKTFSVTKEEEIEVLDLFEYLQSSFIEEVKIRLIETNREKRAEMDNLIIGKAVDFANAKTKLGEQRAKQIVRSAISILRNYYKSKTNYELSFIAASAVEDISNEVSKGVDELKKKIDDNNAMSPEAVANSIRAGKFEDAAKILSRNFSIINNEHCLKPYYGFSLYEKNGKSQLRSVPLISEAESKYPPFIEVIPSDISIDNKSIEYVDMGVMNYSYNHQIPIIISVQDAIKYLGPIEDPIQYEAQELVGKLIEIKPNEFPPAFPCSISVNERVYFDYLMMRTKEILEDGTIILDNREQNNRKFAVVFRMNLSTHVININITVISEDNKDQLLYNEFAYNASSGGELLVKALNTNDKLACGHLNDTGDSDGYLNNIDILKKVITVENYFCTKITIPEAISMEDYDDLTRLSELIADGAVKHKWTGYTFTFDLSRLKKETIINTEDVPYAMQFTVPIRVEIFNLKEEIVIRRTINDLRFKDLDKLKKKVELMDEDDVIKVKIIPNPDRDGFNDCVDELVRDAS